MYGLDIGFIIKLLKRKLARGKGENSKLSQKDANPLWENGPVDMAQRYATTTNLFLLVCFYTPLVPVAPAIGCIGALVSYWVDKAMLLRRHKMPEMMGSTMAKFFSNLIPYSMILYGIGNHVFTQTLGTGDTNMISLGVIIFTVCYIFLPIRFCLNKCAGDFDREACEPYSSVKLDFPSDYDRANPMTQKDALLTHFEAMMKKFGGESDEEAQKQAREAILGIDSLQAYAQKGGMQARM